MATFRILKSKSGEDFCQKSGIEKPFLTAHSPDRLVSLFAFLVWPMIDYGIENIRNRDNFCKGMDFKTLQAPGISFSVEPFVVLVGDNHHWFGLSKLL